MERVNSFSSADDALVEMLRSFRARVEASSQRINEASDRQLLGLWQGFNSFDEIYSGHAHFLGRMDRTTASRGKMSPHPKPLPVPGRTAGGGARVTWEEGLGPSRPEAGLRAPSTQRSSHGRGGVAAFVPRGQASRSPSAPSGLRSLGDKHIEVIGRQMMRWVKIEEVGESDFLVDEVVDFYRFMRENAKLEAASKAPADAKRILLGITKASLSTDSFISAASRFQPANGQPR